MLLCNNRVFLYFSPKETTLTNEENKEHSENQIRRALRKQKKLLKRKSRGKQYTLVVFSNIYYSDICVFVLFQ